MSYTGMGSYYEYKPHQVYSGMGACGLGKEFSFNGANAWSKWLTCTKAYDSKKKVVPQCNVVNDIRAALNYLGLGQGTGQGASWDSADQAALREACSHLGISCGSGLPTKDNLIALENALKKDMVIGDEPIMELEKDPESGQFITTGEKGTGLSRMAWIGIGVGAVAILGIVALAAKGKSSTPPARTRQMQRV